MAAMASIKPWNFCLVVSIFFIAYSSGQRIPSAELGLPNNGICGNMFCNSEVSLWNLKHCVVVMGNLHVTVIETSTVREFRNISFPKLREVTGYVLTYRVNGLESLGKLFPNLARIRGENLLGDYALIVHNNDNLKEIGLLNLIKIDRGGVFIFGGPKTCFIETVDWEAVAPKSKHVIITETTIRCSVCSCSKNAAENHCWSKKHCQRYLEGPKAEKCNDQCLGCSENNSKECSVCRNYTYRGQCVSKCPNNTILLPLNQYCITQKECLELDGWTWNKSCIFECPLDYTKTNDSGVFSCEKCENCEKTCRNLTIQSLDAAQAAERCVYVKGYLILHIRAVPSVMEELKKYLGRIKEVSDYIEINGSMSITSLEFLSSLRKIGGNTLSRKKYSLLVHDMENITKLFTPEVTEHLQVQRGSLGIFNNPKLCMSSAENLKSRFLNKPHDNDIPIGANGYTADCEETTVKFQVRVINETSALILFLPLPDPDISYTVLYARLPYGQDNATLKPEVLNCSESEWYSLLVTSRFEHYGNIELTDLTPAATYVVCIETFNPTSMILARSSIERFSTLPGRPEPPFISVLAALSSEEIILKWVDHKLYLNHITHYELDISLVEIDTKDVLLVDHCKISDAVDDLHQRHAYIMRPPPHYEKQCKYKYKGYLSKLSTEKEYFDICSSLEHGCNIRETDPPKNETSSGYIKTLYLNITGNKKKFLVNRLAPFSDYRLRLRACSGFLCSRSARSVVRTLTTTSNKADKPVVIANLSQSDGFVSIEWEHPKVTNGPILSYFIEVSPNVTMSNDELRHQIFCVPSNTTKFTVKSVVSNVYLVKVCSSTFGLTYGCSNVIQINMRDEEKVIQPTWWCFGIIFGVVLYFTSFIIGFLWKSRVYSNREHDDIPLVEYTSMYRSESEPPVVISDFTPIYLIQLSEPD